MALTNEKVICPTIAPVECRVSYELPQRFHTFQMPGTIAWSMLPKHAGETVVRWNVEELGLLWIQCSLGMN